MTVHVAPLLGGGVSFLIVLAVFIGSAILERLRKGASSSDATVPDQKRPARRAPRRGEIETSGSGATRTAADWEEELRRLLGGEPPPAPAAPPPIPRSPSGRPAPPPPIRPSTNPAPSPVPMAKIEPRFTGAQRVSTIQLPELRESAAAYQQASRLPEQVAGRLKQLDERMQRHSPASDLSRSTTASVEALGATAMLRDPRTIRQAMVISVILAPPQGLAAD